MATVKADAHFVDCDRATGAGGSWQADQYGRLVYAGGITINSSRMELYDEDYQGLINFGSAGDNNSSGCDIGPSGFLAYGKALIDGTTDAVHLCTYAGEVIDRDFVLGDNFVPSFTVPRYLQFSYDGDYIYVTHVHNVFLYPGTLTKFRVSDGALMWHIGETGINDHISPGYNIGQDEYIHVFTVNYPPGVPAKISVLDPEDASVVRQYDAPESSHYHSLYNRNDIAIESSTVSYIIGGTGGGDAPFENIWKYNSVTGEKLAEVAVGSGVQFSRGFFFKGFLYAFAAGSNSLLTKLDSDLNIINTFNFPSGYYPSFHISSETTGTAISDDGTGDKVYEIDLDTMQQTDRSPIGSSLVASGAAYQQWRSYPSPWILSGGAPYSVISTQYRTAAYPQDWAHLEGQTVQVLKDGIYIGDDVVTGGQITLDD